MSLAGVDLSGADLSESDLGGAMLMGARCRGTVLFKATLDGAELAKSDLCGANLTSASCDRTGFAGASLERALLTEVVAPNAAFTQADLTGADLRAADLRECRLREATLVDVDATRADLRGADLDDVVCSDGSFREADLRGARLVGLRGYQSASWLGADLRDVNFVGAYLFRRFAMDQNYLAEFRNRSRLSMVLYSIWWLTSDCGRSVLRWGVCTFAICLAFTVAFAFANIDYGDYETALSPFYFSVVTLTTLGYGDVLPQTAGAQALCIAEVICGYVMLGGMLAIISNKLARRAD